MPLQLDVGQEKQYRRELTGAYLPAMPPHLFLITREYHARRHLPPSELLIKVHRVRCGREGHIEEASQPGLKIVQDLTANSPALIIRMDNHIHDGRHVLAVVNGAAKSDESLAVKGETHECALSERGPQVVWLALTPSHRLKEGGYVEPANAGVVGLYANRHVQALSRFTAMRSIIVRQQQRVQYALWIQNLPCACSSQFSFRQRSADLPSASLN